VLRKAPRSGAFFIACGLVLVGLAAAADPAAETARVAQVVDGDSLRLADGRELRLIGINAPEYGRDHSPEPFAAEARDRLAALIGGGRVRLSYDAERHDRHGRTLAYVETADGRDVQERLLAAGLAQAIAVPPNLARLERYLAAERDARDRKRGLWAHAYFAPHAAETLAPGVRGFRRVRGAITRLGESRKYVYLDLGPRLSLMVAHEDWARYFTGRPQALVGRTVEVRGWITEPDGRPRLRLHHPAMMTLLP
jgi:endonuclease YncB( thermonuclease family)